MFTFSKNKSRAGIKGIAPFIAALLSYSDMFTLMSFIYSGDPYRSCAAHAELVIFLVKKEGICCGRGSLKNDYVKKRIVLGKTGLLLISTVLVSTVLKVSPILSSDRDLTLNLFPSKICSVNG